MPQAVHSLPYVAWVLLVGLAFGSFAFVALTRKLTDATRGYLGFTAFCAGLLALLALFTDWGLTTPADLVIQAGQASSLRQLGLVVFVIGAFIYPMGLWRGWISFGLAGTGAALTLGAAAFGWAPTAVDAVPLLVQLVMLSLVTGGSLAAVVLGHWYLVTPKISDRPLVLQARLLLGLVGLQVLLFIVWTTLGGGPGQAAWDAFSGGNLLLVILRLIVTLLFPLILCAMAWRTARRAPWKARPGCCTSTSPRSWPGRSAQPHCTCRAACCSADHGHRPAVRHPAPAGRLARAHARAAARGDHRRRVAGAGRHRAGTGQIARGRAFRAQPRIR